MGRMVKTQYGWEIWPGGIWWAIAGKHRFGGYNRWMQGHRLRHNQKRKPK